MGGLVKVAPLAKKTDAMVKDGVLKAHQRILADMASFFRTADREALAEIALQHVLARHRRADLRNPSDKSLVKDWPNIRDELTQIFTEHAGLAQSVAEEITGMQGDFDDMRKKLTDEFGADSDQVKALNDV